LNDLALPRRVVFRKVACGDPFDLRSQGAQAGPELVASGDRLQEVFVHRSLAGASDGSERRAAQVPQLLATLLPGGYIERQWLADRLPGHRVPQACRLVGAACQQLPTIGAERQRDYAALVATQPEPMFPRCEVPQVNIPAPARHRAGLAIRAQGQLPDDPL